MPHTLVVADTHGHWEPFLSFLWSHRPAVCFVAGDFGWWPGFELARFLREKPSATEIRFVDGNHEDHVSLRALTRAVRGVSPDAGHEAFEIAEGLWYQPRGSTYRLSDGRTVFCVGGAAPVRNGLVIADSPATLRRKDLPEVIPKADIVLAHTLCGRAGLLAELPALQGKDPSTDVLDDVFAHVRPKLWLCGHLHRHIRCHADGCEFVVLDLLARSAPRLPGSYVFTLVD